MEGRVVVAVNPVLLHSERLGKYAARILPLGLTAYADTPTEARARVRELFRVAVETRRCHNQAEAWLKRCGAEWWWEDAYTGNLPVIDTADNDGDDGNGGSGSSEAGWEDLSEPYRMAA